MCNGAEYPGCNYSVMGDKMTREETEVSRCCILMPVTTLQSASLNNSPSCNYKLFPTCAQLIKRDAHQQNFGTNKRVAAASPKKKPLVHLSRV